MEKMRLYLPFLLMVSSIVLFVFSKNNIQKKAQVIPPPVIKTYNYIPMTMEEHLTYKLLLENLAKETKLNVKISLENDSIKIEGDRDILYKFLEIVSFINDIQNIGKVQFKSFCLGEDCNGLQMEVIFMKLMIQ